jgi:hypothetical protein
VVWVATALALGCASAPVPAASRAPRCAAVPGAEQVLVPGSVVILGEIPGTVEMPQFAAALACLSLASGKPVTLALEIPREERPEIDSFLASDGSETARAALLAAPSWRERASSVARLELLEWVRAARAAGKPIWVTLLDSAALPVRSAATEREREQRMATALLAALDAAPQNVFIGLVANPHARVVRDTSVQPPYPPMSYLVERGLPEGSVIFALDARFPAGEAWVCSPGDDPACGPAAIAGRGEPGEPFRVVLGGDVDRTFNGFYQLPSLTASPPAVGLRRAPPRNRTAAAR